MKFAIGIAVLFWLLCGIIGAWWLGDLDSVHWKLVAKGPITMVHAFIEKPVSVPGTG